MTEEWTKWIVDVSDTLPFVQVYLDSRDKDGTIEKQARRFQEIEEFCGDEGIFSQEQYRDFSTMLICSRRAATRWVRTAHSVIRRLERGGSNPRRIDKESMDRVKRLKLIHHKGRKVMNKFKKMNRLESEVFSSCNPEAIYAIGNAVRKADNYVGMPDGYREECHLWRRWRFTANHVVTGALCLSYSERVGIVTANPHTADVLKAVYRNFGELSKTYRFERFRYTVDIVPSEEMLINPAA